MEETTPANGGVSFPEEKLLSLKSNIDGTNRDAISSHGDLSDIMMAFHAACCDGGTLPVLFSDWTVWDRLFEIFDINTLLSGTRITTLRRSDLLTIGLVYTFSPDGRITILDVVDFFICKGECDKSSHRYSIPKMKALRSYLIRKGAINSERFKRWYNYS
jgi:hypothetical protein